MMNDPKAKAMRVYQLLIERYGTLPLVPRRKPMHELISTISMSNRFRRIFRTVIG